jgi:hypothetical protein
MLDSQGCYSQEGDIVVLCAYLGQLAKVRDALSHEVAIVIDERDQAALDDQEGDNDERDGAVTIEHVKVSKRVRRILLYERLPFSLCLRTLGTLAHCR